MKSSTPKQRDLSAGVRERINPRRPYGSSSFDLQYTYQDGFHKIQESLDNLDDSQKPKTKRLLDFIPANDLHIAAQPRQFNLANDMMFGWKPKHKENGPVPLNFDSALVEDVVDYFMALRKEGIKTKNGEELIYLGFRPFTSYQMHQYFQEKSSYVDEVKTLEKQAEFHKFFESQLLKSYWNEDNDFFVEANCLKFNAHFESGNLDAVIRTSKNEYDLYVRVDSNTRGHNNWYIQPQFLFYFKVTNMKKNQKVRINIVNLTRYETLFTHGAKPYVFSQKLNENHHFEWQQSAEDISYKKSSIRYSNFVPKNKRYYTLSFEYTFPAEDDEVSFALCIPYTYSYLLEFINTLKTKYGTGDKAIIQENELCQSLGGVKVPVLTITDPNEDETVISDRPYIVCTGRVHPGESNGSIVLHGFIEELCKNTEAAISLRKRYVFKIVPMLNPDGVIMGNHRTGFCGSDLNRQFINPDSRVHVTVFSLKKMVKELQSKQKVLFYMDFHGHNAKKNVFMYGPEHPLHSNFYLRVRLFPKIVGLSTDMFRFQACRFRIPKNKAATARNVFSKHMEIDYAYTIEASYGSYFKEDRTSEVFDQEKFMKMGRIIFNSLYVYDVVLEEEENKKPNRIIKKSEDIETLLRNKKIYELFPVLDPNRPSTQEKEGSKSPSKIDKTKENAENKISIMDKLLKHIEGEVKEVEEENKSDSDSDSDTGAQEDNFKPEDLEFLHKQIVTNIDFFNEFLTKGTKYIKQKLKQRKTSLIVKAFKKKKPGTAKILENALKTTTTNITNATLENSNSLKAKTVEFPPQVTHFTQASPEKSPPVQQPSSQHIDKRDFISIKKILNATTMGDSISPAKSTKVTITNKFNATQELFSFPGPENNRILSKRQILKELTKRESISDLSPDISSANFGQVLYRQIHCESPKQELPERSPEEPPKCQTVNMQLKFTPAPKKVYHIEQQLNSFFPLKMINTNPLQLSLSEFSNQTCFPTKLTDQTNNNISILHILKAKREKNKPQAPPQPQQITKTDVFAKNLKNVEAIKKILNYESMVNQARNSKMRFYSVDLDDSSQMNAIHSMPPIARNTFAPSKIRVRKPKY